jgi:hypothetical protein
MANWNKFTEYFIQGFLNAQKQEQFEYEKTRQEKMDKFEMNYKSELLKINELEAQAKLNKQLADAQQLQKGKIMGVRTEKVMEDGVIKMKSFGTRVKTDENGNTTLEIVESLDGKEFTPMSETKFIDEYGGVKIIEASSDGSIKTKGYIPTKERPTTTGNKPDYRSEEALAEMDKIERNTKSIIETAIANEEYALIKGGKWKGKPQAPASYTTEYDKNGVPVFKMKNKDGTYIGEVRLTTSGEYMKQKRLSGIYSGGQPTQQKQQTKQQSNLSPQDIEAKKWALANPNDPRSKQILQRLGE